MQFKHTIVKDFVVESNGRWATIPLTTTSLSVNEADGRPTKSQWCGCAKWQAGRKTLRERLARAHEKCLRRDAPQFPKRLAWGLVLFELAHNWMPIAHFKISSSRNKLTTDHENLLTSPHSQSSHHVVVGSHDKDLWQVDPDGPCGVREGPEMVPC